MKSIMFSKGLQYLSVEKAAEKIAEMGFKGIDLTVREGGHIEPEEVREKLQMALRIINKTGLDLSMLTTDIKHPKDKMAESIYQSASECGVKFLKLGYIPYTYGTYRDNLEMMKKEAKDFESLGKKYGICACHHIHSADFMTQSALVLDEILFDIDPDLSIAPVITVAAIATGFKIKVPVAEYYAFNLNGASTLNAVTHTFRIIQDQG